MLTKKLFPRKLSGFFNAIVVLFVFVGSFSLPTNTHALGLAITDNTAADNTANDGLCSLREAITNANKNYQFYTDCTSGLSDDGIFFSNSMGAATITLTSALPPIKDFVGLSINGGGDITIDGSVYQVFLVNNRVPLALDGLKVTRGFTASNGGGLLSNGGFVTITNCTFLENRASNGGGVYNNGGNLTITNSSFQKNSAGINVPGNNDGGGVYQNGGVLTITNSTFSANGVYSEGSGVYIASGTTTITNSTFSGNGNAFSDGAGVFAAAGNLTITLSTFSGNIANLAGGVFVSSGTADIANSTFSGNKGGGVQNLGTMTIKNSTFSGNTSNAGGGITNMGTLSLVNTILANSITGRDCFTNPGSPVTGNNNLIEADSLSPNTCGTGALAVDPRLGALAGTPAYHPLNSGSPAINAGDDAACASLPVSNTSQNGVARPQGAHCDIGSYEAPGAASLSSQEKIGNIAEAIDELANSGGISVENVKILNSMLDASLESLNTGDPSTSIKVLVGFEDQVKLFVDAKEIESTQGQELIDLAQAVIDEIQ